MTPVELEQVRKDREEKHRIQREEDVKTLLNLPAGQRFFFDFIDRITGVMSGSFRLAEVSPGCNGDGAPMTMAFNEGRRSVGIEVMNELQRVAPLSYQAMFLEAIRTQNFDAATRAAEAVPTTGQSYRR